MKQTRSLSFTLPYSERAKVAMRSAERLRQEANAIEKEVYADVRLDKQIGLAKALSGYEGGEPKVKLERHSAEVTFCLIEKVDRPPAPDPVVVQPKISTPRLNPATLNLLLNSNLLTKAEKRDLIAQMDPALAKIMETKKPKISPSSLHSAPREMGHRTKIGDRKTVLGPDDPQEGGEE